VTQLRKDGKIVGEHYRLIRSDQTVFDPGNYVPVLAAQPGALRKRRAVKRTGS